MTRQIFMVLSTSKVKSLLIKSTKFQPWIFVGLAFISSINTASAESETIVKPGDEVTRVFEKLHARNYGEATPIEPVDYDILNIRGVFVIDGTGAPPYGPVDISIENGEIRSINTAAIGAGVPMAKETANKGTLVVREIQAQGKYVMPGLIDAHVHTDVPFHSLFGPVPSIDYVFKLWLGHGITTVREVGSFGGLTSTLNYKKLSEKNLVAAPRFVVMPAFPIGYFSSTKEARQWVVDVKKRGADGVKFIGGDKELVKAALEEIAAQGMTSAFHHPQLNVMDVNALQSAEWGNTSIEHWYGLPEAMFEDRRIQHYSYDYNYSNEQDRFGEAGDLWAQSAQPGSAGWNTLIDKLLATGVTLDPTFSIYEANRDVDAVSSRPWFKDYIFPGLKQMFEPNTKIHGSYFFDWTTADEVKWKRNYILWMQFVNDFKNRGGRVTVGSDAGFIYNLNGFGYVRGLEMLQEAGFHPLEVVRAATLSGAELLNVADEIGTIKIGKKADLLILDENPLPNFKLLYGTGHIRLNTETQQVERIHALRYTIKDGIVFDAAKLLTEVRKMVQDTAQASATNHPSS